MLAGVGQHVVRRAGEHAHRRVGEHAGRRRRACRGVGQHVGRHVDRHARQHVGQHVVLMRTDPKPYIHIAAVSMLHSILLAMAASGLTNALTNAV